MAPLAPSLSETIILITGINSYIGSHVGVLLLSQGYTVRGTSRSASAKTRLTSGPYAPYISTYQHTLVPDITTPSAFDTAVAGVHAIVHVASPVDFTLSTLDAYVTPAMSGVTSILDSAHRCAGPQLQTFVLTSSIAAIADKWAHPFFTPYAYTETDWNVNGLQAATDNFTPPVAYGASKAAAERAMWSFNSTHKPDFACVAINPGVVMGPPVLLPTSPAGLNLTLKPIWDIYTNSESLQGKLPPQIGGATWVDVRDVAEIHAWAATHPDEARKGRFLATNGQAPPQAIADLLREEFPEREILEGNPGQGYVAADDKTSEQSALQVSRFGKRWGWVIGGQSADAAKMRLVLGQDEKERELRGFRECVLDTVAVLEPAFANSQA